MRRKILVYPQNEALQQEILDLQSEFEFDRIDYLDTIRKQERQMSWLQSVIDRIHACLRRDCNYTNLDKVKMQSEWNEDNQCWNLPKMIIEKSTLPAAPPGE
jgi:kinesin family protein 3/17